MGSLISAWDAIVNDPVIVACIDGITVGDKPWKGAGTKAARIAVNQRVCHEAYPGESYSYALAARAATGISEYQWRAPGEWFAEIYALYYLGKLANTHSMYAWFEENAEAEGVPGAVQIGADMSLFESAKASCPKCGTPHQFEIVAQRQRRPSAPTCGRRSLTARSSVSSAAKCKTEFSRHRPCSPTSRSAAAGGSLQQPGRLRPEVWKDVAEIARDGFDKAYGANAAAAAREIGAGLKVRESSSAGRRCARSFCGGEA